MEKKYKFFVCIALLISLLTTTVNLSCYADKLININTETKMIKDANELIDCVENTVTLKYAKTPYKSTEIFQVEFIANTELKDDYSKEIIYNIKTYANSFEIISSNADYKNNTITVSLKYLNDDTYPIFTIEIQSGNATIIGKIYGYNTKYGLFISPSSYYAARDNYYTYAIDNKIITKEEYEEIIAIDSRNGVKEESWTTSAENSDSKSRNTYVAGTLKWEDGNSIDHPLKYTKIQIYDKDAIGSDDLLGTVYTNSTGNYSFTFQNQLFDRQDIYIKVYPEGEGTKVLTDNGNAYIYVSPISNNVSTGSTTHKNFTAHMDEDDMQKAFQISQSVIFAAKYAKQMHDNPMSNVEVYYPHGTGNCSYSSTYKRINITGANSSHPDGLQSYASWDVIMHEYGHHVQHELDIILHDGSSHGPGLNIADQLYNNRANNGYTEEECKEIGMGIGWSEAWATVFGNLAQ